MSGEEFMRWVTFDLHDPLPDRRMDWHFAALSALTLNLHAKRAEGGSWGPAELRLFSKAWERPQSAQERRAAVAQTILSSVRAWNAGRQHER
jgi:hypothetical protein